MRRRQHARRTNVSLGVCTVDLSGPHEPTPRPGKQIHRDPATYFLVLTVRPDTSADTVDRGIQTEDAAPAEPAADAAAAVQLEPQPRLPPRPLVYAALLGSKAEAPDAVKGLLAKVNDDHASLPHTLIYRVHSDDCYYYYYYYYYNYYYYY